MKTRTKGNMNTFVCAYILRTVAIATDAAGFLNSSFCSSKARFIFKIFSLIW